jgi:hypothetical protein
MTKIKELEHEYLARVNIKGDDVTDAHNFLNAYKAAIREQVVVDALPKVVSSEYEDDMDVGFRIGYNDAVDNAIRRLTTREEVERPFVELLKHLKAEHAGYLKNYTPLLFNLIIQLTDGK